MKKIALSLAMAAISMAAVAQTPAFPGAEGHGRYVTGGRAADGTTKIYHVTNLNNTGEGSLRWALSQAGPRTIVFDVGGVIELASNLNIPANTTIAGQTAPYPGITLRYYTVNPNGNNIIMRYIRIRRGEEKNVNDGADASTARHFTGIIIDHCSFSWSIDEVASFYDNNNFTMQWCTLGESLNNAGHGKGAHGYGGIWGGKLASFHHNIILHVNNRSPRFNGARYDWTGYTSNKRYSEFNWQNAVQAENVDFRNCIVYNCGNGCYGGPGGGYVNIYNNYYKTGPAATTNRVTTVTVGASGNAEGYPIYWTMTSRYFIEGNYFANKDGSTNTSPTNNNWGAVSYDSGTFFIDNERYSKDVNHYYGDGVTYKQNRNGEDCVRIKLDEPTHTGDITTHSAQDAYSKVLSFAGVSIYRDGVDTRYAEEISSGTATYKGSVTGKAGRIDVVADQGTYELESTSRAADFDADNDGMPDAWEQANGGDLDPNKFTVDPQGKYSNIEVYLSGLVEENMKNGNDGGSSNYTEYYPQSNMDPITSISKTFTNDAAVSTSYYTIDGREVDINQANGVLIRVEKLANGQTRTSKVIK